MDNVSVFFAEDIVRSGVADLPGSVGRAVARGRVKVDGKRVVVSSLHGWTEARPGADVILVLEDVVKQTDGTEGVLVLSRAEAASLLGPLVEEDETRDGGSARSVHWYNIELVEEDEACGCGSACSCHEEPCEACQ